VKISGWDGPEAARTEVRNGIACYAASKNSGSA
jgi:hypothetical protein